jgi:hypothetical protein
MVTASLALAVYCLVVQRPTDPAVAAPSEDILAWLADNTPRFELLDERGKRHKASLLQIDGDRLVVRAQKKVFTVPASEFQRVYRRGDSPWNGTLIGLGVGFGMWMMVASNDQGLGLDTKLDNPDDFTLADTVGMIGFCTALGYIIDTLHVGRHSVLVGPMQANAPKATSGLTLNVAGPPRERRLQVGYRLSF